MNHCTAMLVAQELIRKGKRERIKDWKDFVRKSKNQEYLRYLKAGFTNIDLVETFIRENIEVDTALALKKELISRGFEEDDAEEWLTLDLKDLNWLTEIYQRGYKDSKLIGKIITNNIYCERITVELLDELSGKLEKKGFSKEEALCELVITTDLFLLNQYQILEKQLKRYNILSAYLFKSIKEYLEDKNCKPSKEFIKEIHKRIKFYRSLGLSRVEAEWWVSNEINYDKKLDYETVQAWLKLGLKRPWEIADVFETIIQLPSNAEMEKVIELYKAGASSFDIAYVIKVLTERKTNQLPNLDEFIDLFKRSLCQVRELVFWIEKEGKQEVEEWFSLNINDFQAYSVLKELGYSPYKVKDLLEVFSLEEILTKADEGKSYSDMVRFYLSKKKSYDFKLKF